MHKLIIYISLLIFSVNIRGAVWDSEFQWSKSWEERYSKWIESSEFNPNIFSSKVSPFYGIKSDCSDAIFAYRAIFSFKNKLNFKYKLYGEIYSNSSNEFDHIQAPLDRLRAFIHKIGEVTGTESLARENSFSIELEDISPGDIYVSRWKRNGQYIRHAYLIKSILPTGHLVLYSSTTPVKVRKLAVRKGMPLHILSGEPWGFKRMKNHIQDDFEQSNSQYSLLAEVGDKYFFNRVVDILKKEEDTLEANLLRRIENLCIMLKDRALEVKSAIQYQNIINNRCMTSNEYHEYSTPSRDKSLINGIKRLMFGWKKINDRSDSVDVSSELAFGLNYLIRRERSDSARADHFKLCHVKLGSIKGKNRNFSLKTFYDGYQKKLISSNPNKSLASRWGLEKQRSSCSVFY